MKRKEEKKSKRWKILPGFIPHGGANKRDIGCNCLQSVCRDHVLFALTPNWTR